MRDYIAQSGEFTVCIFCWPDRRSGLARRTIRPRRRRLLLAALFFANILYVSTSRTVLVVFPVLLLLFAIWHLSLEGHDPVLLAASLRLGVAWWWWPALVRANVTMPDQRGAQLQSGGSRKPRRRAHRVLAEVGGLCHQRSADRKRHRLDP